MVVVVVVAVWDVVAVGVVVAAVVGVGVVVGVHVGNADGSSLADLPLGL